MVTEVKKEPSVDTNSMHARIRVADKIMRHVMKEQGENEVSQVAKDMDYHLRHILYGNLSETEKTVRGRIHVARVVGHMFEMIRTSDPEMQRKALSAASTLQQSMARKIRSAS